MAKSNDYDFYCDVALKPNAAIEIVLETDKVLAFKHTKPSYEKHIVVVPKVHVHDLRFVEDQELLAELLDICKKVLEIFDAVEVEKKGARIVTNLGKFQDTPHLHFHVILGKKLDVKVKN